MNLEQDDKIIEKYKEGTSSIKEENHLRDRFSIRSDMYSAWFKFTGEARIKAPTGIEDKVIGSIETHKKKYKRTFYSITSAAAFIIILVTSVLFSPLQAKEMSYVEKLAVLVEANNMFDSEIIDNKEKDILYEDETIILFIK
jgi:hypothetical protein